MNLALGILGLLLVALLATFLASYLRDFFSVTDLITSIYIAILSFLAALTGYGLLLFRWGVEAGLYVASSIFAVVVGLFVIARHFARQKALAQTEARSTIKESSSRFSYVVAIGVIGSVVTFGLGYLIYQNPVYPRGFDGGWHYVWAESLLILGSLPTYELGTLTPPFYQRGYHMAIGALAFLTHLPLPLILDSFNLIIYATIPLAVWLLTFVSLRSKTVASLASLSSVFLATFIVVRGGNYPFLMSFHFLALGLALTLHTIRHKRRLEWKLLVVMAVVGLLLIAIHPIVAEIYVLFAIGFFVFGFRRQLRVHDMTRALLPVYSIISGVVIYWLLYPTFFGNQLSFALGRFSNALGSDPFLTSAIRTAVPEAIILYLSLFLLPPALIGILWAVRRKELWILSMVSVASTLFFVQILPVNAREPYIVLLPITLVAGIGLDRLFGSHFSSRGAKRKVVVPIFLVLVVAISANTMVQVASNPMIGVRVYLSDAESGFAEMLIEQGITGRRMATLNNPAVARIGSLSGSDVVIGDRRYTSLAQYRDIHSMLLEDDCVAIRNTSAEYQVDSILLMMEWGPTPGILLNFARCFGEGIILEQSGFVLFYWGV